MKVNITTEKWLIRSPFRISGMTLNEIETVTVALHSGDVCGRGEGIAIFYHDETTDLVVSQIESVRQTVEDGISREALKILLPPGAARNALDCALWDLTAKEQKKSIWRLLDISPKALTTVYTIGIGETDDMGARARMSTEPILKVKIDSNDPLNQIRVVHEARPDARLIVDANQGLSFDQLFQLIPQVAPLGVEMIEQPLPVGGDDELLDFNPAIPLCADESCLTTSDVDYIAERYQMVNIKLDKTGGLTEALELVQAAKSKGLELMVGSMMGTSLSQAPTFVIGQYCKYVDIDGPLLLSEDRRHPMTYKNGVVSPPSSTLWG